MTGVQTCALPISIKFLSNLHWSGNVRQLENVCHWLTVMAPGQNIDVADLPAELKDDQAQPNNATSWQDALAAEVTQALNRGEQHILETRTHAFEKILITKALEHTGGRRIEAATQLGMGRNTLTRKVQELGIED